ncbi:MAG: NRDE family protein [Dongiaceae bacterium]
MCSIVILYRPTHDWPVLIGANRDEMADRPWDPPGRHWPDRPQVVAGRDRLAGGSWLGMNDQGVVAGIMNRSSSLGPAPGKRSRGELVLEALDHADAEDAAEALAALDPGAYRPFNMAIADNRDAYWLRNLGIREGWVEVEKLPPGLSMLTAHDRNDTANSKRIAAFLPRFEAAPVPDPETGDWRGWAELLASREIAPGGGPYDTMNIGPEKGFGTLSSALIALPRPGLERPPVWLAAGTPFAANSFVGLTT